LTAKLEKLTDLGIFLPTTKLPTMRIFLVGYMGCGKTTVGRQLAKLLNYAHLDLDVLFEAEYKITIADFFKKYDEIAFRKIEHQLLLSTFNLENHVISTGGGTPCFFNNMDLINQHGISVYIKMHPKSLFFRLLNSKRTRPLTSGLDEVSLLKSIEEKLAKRETFYNQAQIIVKGEDIDVAALVRILKSHDPI
jgi:shikimate kinase